MGEMLQTVSCFSPYAEWTRRYSSGVLAATTSTMRSRLIQLKAFEKSSLTMTWLLLLCNGNLLRYHGVVERNRISSLQSHGKALKIIIIIADHKRRRAHLSPEQYADSKQQTPAPLFERQAGCRERESTELYDHHLTANHTRTQYCHHFRRTGG